MSRDCKSNKDKIEYLRRHRARYPHFDAAPDDKFIADIAEGKYAFRQHPFYPALGREQRARRFPRSKEPARQEDGSSVHTKKRPIRYPARKDRIIFSSFCYDLADCYEKWLKTFSLDRSVLAYRKAGSNIDHAKRFFEAVEEMAPCYVLCLDIKGFFDNIGHKRLKASVEYIWRFGTGEGLSPDHIHVLRSLMKAAYVDEKDVRHLRVLARQRGRSQITYPCMFRRLVEQGKIRIHKKVEDWGIPQGFASSDLLSNIHMAVFDLAMARITENGWYGRYADDIALIVPAPDHASDEDDRDYTKRIEDTVSHILSNTDENLAIGPEKTKPFVVRADKGDFEIKFLNQNEGSKIQYLGFE